MTSDFIEKEKARIRETWRKKLPPGVDVEVDYTAGQVDPYFTKERTPMPEFNIRLVRIKKPKTLSEIFKVITKAISNKKKNAQEMTEEFIKNSTGKLREYYEDDPHGFKKDHMNAQFTSMLEWEKREKSQKAPCRTR